MDFFQRGVTKRVQYDRYFLDSKVVRCYQYLMCNSEELVAWQETVMRRISIHHEFKFLRVENNKRLRYFSSFILLVILVIVEEYDFPIQIRHAIGLKEIRKPSWSSNE